MKIPLKEFYNQVIVLIFEISSVSFSRPSVSFVLFFPRLRIRTAEQINYKAEFCA